MKVVLFLCTGNYYRSRYAEELFNFLAPSECPGWTATSRGIAVDLGSKNVGPIARSAGARLREIGMDFDPQLARMPLQLQVSDLERSDHIVALKYTEHLPLLKTRFLSWLSANPSRVEYWHVHDVDQIAPEQALPLIEEELCSLIGRIRTAAISANRWELSRPHTAREARESVVTGPPSKDSDPESVRRNAGGSMGLNVRSAMP